MDFQEDVFRTVRKMYVWGASSVGAKKVCLEDLNKYIFLKSEMKPVVKYCVY